ncbi:hypothetical protein VTL71DRAFT_2452 [Oculimacula yallundae]|uniref:Uncharacterized protein n=1 Tax=Oculimacula yallundae TaxID=86028 RepID=A0ABR4CA95_9HELO
MAILKERRDEKSSRGLVDRFQLRFVRDHQQQAATIIRWPLRAPLICFVCSCSDRMVSVVVGRRADKLHVLLS